MHREPAALGFAKRSLRRASAGHPGEFVDVTKVDKLLAQFGVSDLAGFLAALRREGSAPNGVFGVKQGYSQPQFGRLIDLFKGAAPSGSSAPLAIWESAFPNHKHIFMTRRNKLRLAVSWWRATKSEAWHRRHRELPSNVDLAGRYDFQAIDRLLSESVLREAGIQEMFSESRVVPLTIVYEDMRQDLAAAVRDILRYLALEGENGLAPATDLERIADDVSEEWVQRFRREKQSGWCNLGW